VANRRTIHLEANLFGHPGAQYDGLVGGSNKFSGALSGGISSAQVSSSFSGRFTRSLTGYFFFSQLAHVSEAKTQNNLVVIFFENAVPIGTQNCGERPPAPQSKPYPLCAPAVQRQLSTNHHHYRAGVCYFQPVRWDETNSRDSHSSNRFANLRSFSSALQDIDFGQQRIQVRRAYVYGQFGKPKSEASQAPVPLHPILAEQLTKWRSESPYAGEEDFVFPSFRLNGAKPPRANMLVKNLRKAAQEVGIIAPARAFGFHTFRRTLASVLIGNNYDPKLVQEMLRHSNSKTTLDLYAKATTPAKMEAQGQFIKSVFAQEKLASTSVQ